MTNAGGNRNTGPDGRETGAYSVFFGLFTLSCSFSCRSLLFFCYDLFLRDVQNIVQQQARSHGTGRDRRGNGPIGTHSVVFCILLSLLSLFVLHTSSSFSIICVRHQEGRSRAVRDVIGPTPAVTTTLDGTAGQVGGGREEEVEGWG